MPKRLILEWQDSGVRYRLTALSPERREATVVAAGPGARVRVSHRTLDNAAITHWLGMDSQMRTAAAEALLDEGAIGA